MSKSDVIDEKGVREDLDALKDDLRSLRSDMQGLFHDVASAGRSTASNARDRVTDAAKDAASAACERGEQTVDSVDSQVRSHPYTACGVAFLAGALATSLLWTRR
jgi:ElaB/YqjD/DUF883 family membrane-anchored ribosome-binding protein